MMEQFGSLKPEQLATTFRDNPDLLDVMAIFMEDLFVIGHTPEQQARANKSREMFAHAGFITYGDGPHRNTPSLNSIKGLLRNILQQAEPKKVGLLRRLKRVFI